MKIRYVGGRDQGEICFARKDYFFTKDNNWTLDIKEKKVIDYIFSLPNRVHFEIVMEEEKTEEPIKNVDVPRETILTPIIESLKRGRGRPKKGEK